MDDEHNSLSVDIDEDDGDLNEWIVTYSDIVTLLFAFFVLLFSMSSLDTRRFTDSFTAVRRALGTDAKSMQVSKLQNDEGAILETVLLQKQIMAQQRQVYSEIRTFLNRKGVEGVVSAVFDEGIITMRVPSDMLFASGSVELSPEGRQAIAGLRDVFIQHVDQIINIKGFTDDVPPAPGGRFQDNWEISSMRAVNVLRLLLEEGVEPKRMTATGLADLDPIVPNSNDDGRAKNRRVEFVLQRQVGK
ncbi:OmpA/MotB family protein [Megalodesulfovibrio gigas]|uniref:Putative OmpA/MotB domain-containing protein n=1 Tax=Megalodesulfovibrio gigas (strain ATCC 19364 / DSM 1382 / NCIMB 9332 / VKM B-1759) TaxID=1121448 RepID=T2GEX2_MEGG1|nr:OmpA family protein [Megalodesulfovibrio gigas]AGW15120.1 putative OmpA/MotB domain-containing protein [Megalodesulfovibrio gigas DSM 1382 = ATCC 19364]